MAKSPISLAFKNCKKEKRPALVTFTVAGDNTKKNSLKILNSIAKYADILELSELSATATWNVIPGENVRRYFHTALVITC